MKIASRVLFASISIFITLTTLAACSILPSIPAYTSVNKDRGPRPQGRDTRPITEVVRAEFEPSRNVNPSAGASLPFVGIAVSGGGSRAATFATAVFHELDRLGFLSHVTAISSVSGGSLPATYFALNGENIKSEEDWESFHDLMRTSFRSKWLGHYIRPDNLLLNLVTDLDRSDVMAEVFDDVLFKNKTYADLGQGGKRRPTLLINATQIGTSEARRFTFTGTNFMAYTDSELASFPLSRAVMASAAFPGVFNAVTLKNYNTGPPRSTPWPQTYVHLIDGGPADNMGVDALFAAARAHRGTAPISNFSCFMFIVDAYPPNNDSSSLRRDLRSGFTDYIVDSNFIDSVDALLVRRRETTLRDLGFRAEIRGSADNSFSDPAWPKRTTQLTDGFYVGEEKLSRYVIPYQRVLSVPLGTSKEARGLSNAQCLVWHIGMSEIGSVAYSPEDIPPVPDPMGETRHPALVFRQRLWHLTNKIKTDFNLVGPDRCSPKTLQSALRDSAYVLTNEDDTSRKAACVWFQGKFKDSPFSCSDRVVPLRQGTLPLSVEGERPNIKLQCEE